MSYDLYVWLGQRKSHFSVDATTNKLWTMNYACRRRGGRGAFRPPAFSETTGAIFKIQMTFDSLPAPGLYLETKFH